MGVSDLTACVFDLDNTLCDYHHEEQQALAAIGQYLREYWPGLDNAEIGRAYRSCKQGVRSAYRRGLLDLAECYDRRLRFWWLLRSLGIEAEQSFVNGLVKTYWQTRLEHVACLPGAEELLCTLAVHFPLALITNGVECYQCSRMERMGLARHFDVIVVSEAVGVEKPHSQIFLRTLEQLGCHAENAVMVGDSLEMDLEPALRLGMTAVHVRAGLVEAVGDTSGSSSSPTGQDRYWQVSTLAHLRTVLGLRNAD